MEAKGRGDMRSRHERLENEIDRMFLELLRGERTPRYGRAAFRPNADVYYDRSRKAVVVKLELPGIDPQDIDLEVDETMLRVSGVRPHEHHADAVYQQMEISARWPFPQKSTPAGPAPTMAAAIWRSYCPSRPPRPRSA